MLELGLRFQNGVNGLRIDGRRPKEMRRIRCKLGLIKTADGSAYLEMGNTIVLATVKGPKQFRGMRQTGHLNDPLTMKCEVFQAPFAASERKVHRMNEPAFLEIGQTIEMTFKPLVITDFFSQCEIIITIQILSADGGQLSAAINAANLALIDAGIPMRDFLISCTVGFINKTPVLDLNHLEVKSQNAVLPIAYQIKSGLYSVVQLNSRLPLDSLESLITFAKEGCEELYQIFQNYIKSQSISFLENQS